MTTSDDLQKALDKFPKLQNYHYRISDYDDLKKAHEHLSEGYNAIIEWEREFAGVFSCFHAKYEKQMVRLKIAEEKNVEYAKLVASQAEEYAEKLRDKVLVSRKQLEGHVRIVCAANPSWSYCEHCYENERKNCPTGKLLFGKELLESSVKEGSK